MAISKVLHDRRTELQLTLKEIADFVGVSEATVQRWESGAIKNLRQDKIARLAQALRISPSVLMGWEPIGKTSEQRAVEDDAIIAAYKKASPEIQEAIQRILKS